MDDTGTITTIVFISIIVILFLVGLSGWQGAKWRPIAPALSTQIGILGTFTGIAIALLGAGDSSDGRIIALENLISGLRVSVWSSIAGFISFILLKIIYQFSKLDEETQISIDPTTRIVKKLGEIGQDISNVIGRLDNRTELHHQESRKEAAAIENVMQRVINTLEDEQGVVARAVRDFQASSTEERARIEAAFNRFQETMAEQIIGNLISSLERAFTEFNDKLAEHVGGNFQRLNEGIGQLLQWQDQYRTHVEEGAATLGLATEAARESAEKLQAIAEATGTIPGDMQALREAHSILTKQAREVHGEARQLGEAVQGVITQVAEVIENSKNLLAEVLENSKNVLEKNQNAITEIRETLERSSDQLSEFIGSEVTNRVRDLAGVLSGIFTRIRERLEELERTR